MIDLTQCELKRLLHYDSQTGVFTRAEIGKKNFGKPAGCINDVGYVCIKLHSKQYKAHRLAWLYSFGHFPSKFTDHINGVRNDNRLVNLREVTPTENNRNSKITSLNTSGQMGVGWNNKIQKWRSRIHIGGKEIFLGSFKNKEDAIKVRKQAEIEYGFHKNHGR